MTGISPSLAGSTPISTSSQTRIGLALSVLLGLGNIPLLFISKSAWGTRVPPTWLLVFSVAIGLVSIGGAAIAWRSGNRVAIRIDAAALILNGVLVIPGLFLTGVSSGIKISTVVVILLTVVSVLLMLRPARNSLAVLD